MVGVCDKLKLRSGLELGVAVHGLIGLGLWLGITKPHFAHPCYELGSTFNPFRL